MVHQQALKEYTLVGDQNVRNVPEKECAGARA
jgi:hypothetical protein